MEWQSILRWLGRACVGIYIPRIPGVPDEITFFPSSFEMEYEDVELIAEDGTPLHAWFMYPKGWTGTGTVAKHLLSRPVIVFFQENAGNMAMRLPFLRILAIACDCSIFALSYRGYGLSKGSPNESGLKQDARAAFEYLWHRKDIDPTKIVLFGKSLGGAVAIHLAAEEADRIGGLIIENTFTSLEQLAPVVMPILRPFLGPNKPGGLLLRNKWDSLLAIHKVARKPVLLLTSGQDEMIPPSQMRALWQALMDAKAEKVEYVEFPEAHHMDAFEEYGREYWAVVQKFLTRYISPPSSESVESTTARAVKPLANGVLGEDSE
eukprot:jgi/Botrbrau1/14392/Bobra.0014s0040.2